MNPLEAFIIGTAIIAGTPDKPAVNMMSLQPVSQRICITRQGTKEPHWMDGRHGGCS